MQSDDGRRFGRYVVRAELGRGGFATVYLAFDPGLQRAVAIKVLRPELASEPDLAERFSAEARQIARLRHTHIVSVHDVGEQDGLPYFTMDYVEGQTLGALLRARGTLTLAETVNVATQLGSALDYLHARGIVHRDLKPANVMIGDDGRVTLMDFGVARVLDEPGLTMAGGVVGTPHYMAPEQVLGRTLRPAVDVYALAVVLYQCLSGRAPFEGETLAVMHQQAYEAPPPLFGRRPDLPAGVYHVIGAGLEKDPERRPATAGELATRLSAAAGSAGSSSAWPLTPAMPPTRVDAPAPRSAQYQPEGAQSWVWPAARRAALDATVVTPPAASATHTSRTAPASAPPDATVAVPQALPPRTAAAPAYLSKGRRRMLIAMAAVAGVLVAIVAGVVSLFALEGGGSKGSNGGARASATRAGTSVEAGGVLPLSTIAALGSAAASSFTAAGTLPTQVPTTVLPAAITATRAANTITATASPSPEPPPPGGFRQVRNTGTSKCLYGRAAPGTGAPIYVCAIEGFVVRVVEGPRVVEGFDWYNAEGIGWMAGNDAGTGLQLLVPVGPQPVPDFPREGCYSLTLTTVTPGVFAAPDRLLFTVPQSSGAAITSTDGQVSGWLYGSTLYLKYSAPVGTGTIRAQITADERITGNFVATGAPGRSGAEGTLAGTKSARCPA